MGSQVRSVSSGRECGSHETGETLIRYDAYQMTDRIGGLSDSNRTSYGIPRGILKGPPWFPSPPMARSLFSVPIFFIIFRETLEAAIIISVLLGLVEQIVHDDPSSVASNEKQLPDPEDTEVERRKLLRKLRIQVIPISFAFIHQLIPILPGIPGWNSRVLNRSRHRG